MRSSRISISNMFPRSAYASPCLGCGKRALGCHGRCEEYRDYRANKDDENAARHVVRTREIIVDRIEVARSRRERQRANRSNGR